MTNAARRAHQRINVLVVTLAKHTFMMVTPAAVVNISRLLPHPADYAGAELAYPVDALVEDARMPLSAFESLPRTTVCLVSHLPAEILGSGKWSHMNPSWPVAIYPKAVIVDLRVSIWRGLMARLKHDPGKEIVLAGIPFWRGGAVRDALLRAGYMVR